MPTFLNCDLSNFGSDLLSVAIGNFIRTDETFDNFTDFCVLYITKIIKAKNSKQTLKSSVNLLCIPSQYSFHVNYLCVVHVGFVKAEVKLDQSFVNLTAK